MEMSSSGSYDIVWTPVKKGGGGVNGNWMVARERSEPSSLHHHPMTSNKYSS